MTTTLKKLRNTGDTESLNRSDKSTNTKRKDGGGRGGGTDVHTDVQNDKEIIKEIKNHARALTFCGKLWT